MNANFVKKGAVVFAVMMFAGQTNTMTGMAESRDVPVRQFSALQGIEARAMTSSELSKIEAKGTFPYGWGTWFADNWIRSNWSKVGNMNFKKDGTPWGGNANTWYSNAKSAGLKTSKDTPTAGAIVVFNLSDNRGHVAIVTKTSKDKKTFDVKEMNYKGWGITSSRTGIKSTDKSVVGFIYNQKK